MVQRTVAIWWLESKLSDRLWLSFSLALAKPNNNHLTRCSINNHWTICQTIMSEWDKICPIFLAATAAQEVTKSLRAPSVRSTF